MPTMKLFIFTLENSDRNEIKVFFIADSMQKAMDTYNKNMKEGYFVICIELFDGEVIISE